MPIGNGLFSATPGRTEGRGGGFDAFALGCAAILAHVGWTRLAARAGAAAVRSHRAARAAARRFAAPSAAAFRRHCPAQSRVVPAGTLRARAREAPE